MSHEETETTADSIRQILIQSLPADLLAKSTLEILTVRLQDYLERTRLESLAEFAAGAGHEINNPVATILGRSQLLLAGEHAPDRRSALEIIGGQALRIRDMIGDTMLFARPPRPVIGPQVLIHAVREVIQSQQPLVSQRTATVTVQIPENLTVDADPVQLRIVVSQLFRNSLEVMTGGSGEIVITAADHPQHDQDGVLVTLADNGPGFSPEELTHAFDPFYSGRQAGRGLGFGLSKCWRILQQHQGTIRLLNPETGGATVQVWWPKLKAEIP